MHTGLFRPLLFQPPPPQGMAKAALLPPSPHPSSPDLHPRVVRVPTSSRDTKSLLEQVVAVWELRWQVLQAASDAVQFLRRPHQLAG